MSELIYRSTSIIKNQLFQCGDRLYTSKSYKDGPRAKRVILFMLVAVLLWTQLGAVYLHVLLFKSFLSPHMIVAFDSVVVIC